MAILCASWQLRDQSALTHHSIQVMRSNGVFRHTERARDFACRSEDVAIPRGAAKLENGCLHGLASACCFARLNLKFFHHRHPPSQSPIRASSVGVLPLLVPRGTPLKIHCMSSVFRLIDDRSSKSIYRFFMENIARPQRQITSQLIAFARYPHGRFILWLSW